MKETAVEWYNEEINKLNVGTDARVFIAKLFEQAKEMEKSQHERRYSEEEVYHILCEHTAFLFAGGKSTLSDWFEQFKKK